MQQDISSKQMYLLINKALKNCYNDKDEPVNRAIEKFRLAHWEAVKSNVQLNMFDEPIPNLREVRKATNFCDLLDEFRQSVDSYNDNQEELSVSFYRQLNEHLEYFQPHITKENKETFDILYKTIKRHIPEYRNDIILDEYIKRAQEISKLKKDYQKSKQKTTPKTYEYLANCFFEDFSKQEELQHIPSSSKKLSAYSNILNIVDCLPETYKKTDKYKLKISLNQTISSICTDLGETYFLAKENAKREILKYKNAIINAHKHSKGKKLTKEDIRNKRLQEEYLYK